MNRITLALVMVVGSMLALCSCTEPKDPLKPYNHDVKAAIKAGDLKAVKCVVSLEPEWRKMYLLHCAAENGQLAIVKYLLASGVPVNERDEFGRYPITVAAMAGSCDVITFLLSKGADIEQKDEVEHSTPLMAAVREQQKDAVKLLIAKGAQVNAPDKHGYTPLNIATAQGNEDTIAILKKHDAKLGR